jgi:hypothetical protein
MYYRGYYPLNEKEGDNAGSQTANLATSPDGIHFERPNLGLVEFQGSTVNNIIHQSQQAHNFCAFRDDNPNAESSQRFKAVGGSGTDNLHGFCSPDGIHWERIQEGPLKVTGSFDSVNVPMWDSHTSCYRLFSRYFSRGGFEGVRAIQSCTSEDFIGLSRSRTSTTMTRRRNTSTPMPPCPVPAPSRFCFPFLCGSFPKEL